MDWWHLVLSRDNFHQVWLCYSLTDYEEDLGQKSHVPGLGSTLQFDSNIVHLNRIRDVSFHRRTLQMDGVRLE